MYLTYLSALVRRFVKNEEAASAIEYAVIVAMVALVLFAMVGDMGGAVKGQFNKIITALGGTPAS
jgi:pilus assembly protein Flp/PilA